MRPRGNVNLARGRESGRQQPAHSGQGGRTLAVAGCPGCDVSIGWGMVTAPTPERTHNINHLWVVVGLRLRVSSV
jgi:hypothetical protein